MLKNPKAWWALIAHTTKANNQEVASGMGMSPNKYMERFVRDGKQAMAWEADGDDTKRTTKAEREKRDSAGFCAAISVAWVGGGEVGRTKAWASGARPFKA